MAIQSGNYPPNWREIADRLKAEVGFRCEWCGVEGERTNKNGRQLSVHHLDGDPSHNARINLAVLCAKCHLSDQQRVFAMLRRQRLEAAGQLVLPIA